VRLAFVDMTQRMGTLAGRIEPQRPQVFLHDLSDCQWRPWASNG
jgi:hypothetical protein